MAAPNTEPIFSRQADVQGIDDIKTQNQTIDISTGTYYLVFVADGVNGGYVRDLRFKFNYVNGASGASVLRIWLNKGQRAATATASNNQITDTSHTLAIGDTIMIDSYTTASGVDAGIALNTVYYVKTWVDANNFTLSLTDGGTALDILQDCSALTYHPVTVRSGVYTDTAVSTEVGVTSSWIIGELGLPSQTPTLTGALPDFSFPLNFGMKPGQRIYVSLGTTFTNSVEGCCVVYGGKY